jgi:Amt family ammonium transporter
MAGSLLHAPQANPSFGGTGPRVATTIVGQLGAQAAGVGIALLWSLVLTYAIAKIAALFVPMRVDAEAEHDGLDLSSHGERAYEFD